MEYVRILFTVKRDAYVDDNNAGQTNEILRVSSGTHKFHLGDPKNYTPGEITTRITDTTEFSPKEITFEEVPNDSE